MGREKDYMIGDAVINLPKIKGFSTCKKNISARNYKSWSIYKRNKINKLLE